MRIRADQQPCPGDLPRAPAFSSGSMRSMYALSARPDASGSAEVCLAEAVDVLGETDALFLRRGTVVEPGRSLERDRLAGLLQGLVHEARLARPDHQVGLPVEEVDGNADRRGHRHRGDRPVGFGVLLEVAQEVRLPLQVFAVAIIARLPVFVKVVDAARSVGAAK